MDQPRKTALALGEGVAIGMRRWEVDPSLRFDEGTTTIRERARARRLCITIVVTAGHSKEPKPGRSCFR
jgi:hypothetical protein